MSFPLSPTNGQLIVVNGINYIWDASKGAWRRVQSQFITNFQNAYDAANSAFDYANASFIQANTINASVSAAYTQANTNATAITLIQGVNVYQNTAITNVGNIVSGAFAQANAANNLAQSAYNAANSSSGSSAAFAQANAANNLATSAYGKANSADTLATAAFNAANTGTTAAAAFTQANAANNLATSGYAQANATNTLTNSAYGKANSADGLATSGYAQANASNALATSGYGQANNANILAGAAFGAANTNASAITLIQGVNVSQNTNITAVSNYATSGYGQANAANNLAAAAYAKANLSSAGTPSGFTANSVIIANTGGYLSQTSNLQFLTSNNSLIVVGKIISDNVTVTNILGPADSNTTIVASNYTTTFDTTGRLTVPGPITFADGTSQNTAVSSVLVQASFDRANAANNLAQSAYNAANTGSVATAAFAQANAANNLATSGYAQANASNNLATSGYIQANAANNLASAAYNKANTISFTGYATESYVNNAVANLVNSAPTTLDTLKELSDALGADANFATTVATNIGNVNNKSNAAYNQANSANILAGAAFASSNTNATAITLIQGVNDGQNTRITAVDAYATSGYGQANAANGLAAAAFAAANSGTGATFAYAQANAANILAQSAYNNSNTKVFIFYQNTAPTSANVRDGWVNSDTGVKYENLSNTTPLWVELGPTTAVSESPIASAAFDKANTAITTSGGSITGRLNIAFSSTGTGYPLSVSAANTQGGTGYSDFLKVTNTSAGATNPNKSFRLSSAGAVEIINSAYNATILSLSDTGGLSVPVAYQVSGKQAVNGPAFSAYASSSLQTITSGSQQKVLFQTEEFDTNSNFTNSRFTPTVEGYYQLNAEVRLDGATGTGECMIILYKNGSEYKRGWNSSGTQFASNFWAMTVSSLVYANGTGDYFEIYVQQGSGGSVTVTAVNNPAITWFNGCMLRGA